MSLLSRPYFHDEPAAFAFLESILWASGTVCPKCGTIGEAGKLEGVRSKGSKKNPEGVERHGLWKCYACRQQFTVRVGTVFESAHIPLHKMLQAVYLLSSSKKGISAHQIHRALEITYKSAWFLCHRIREAMREGKLPPMGGEGKTVEMDETYIGGRDKNKHANKRPRVGRGGITKEIAFSLVERGGKVRSHHVASVSGKTLRPILAEQLDAASTVMSDTGGARLAKDYAKHGMVNHGIGEYVRGEVSTNSVEGYFSILKRGINGVYHHVSPQHLKRYLAEFDFRYNERSALGVEDAERAAKALQGIVGKRLTYKKPD
jgi:transposase-like protein